MWNQAQQHRLDELRRREQEHGLSHAERNDVARLVGELEREEWTRLEPALTRLTEEERQLVIEQARAQAQNTALAALAEKYADLIARARHQLAAPYGHTSG